VKSILICLSFLLVPAFVTAQTPEQVAEELLAADRAFAAASAKTDLISGISAMFVDDVAMPTPAGVVYGSQKAIDALRANSANANAKVEWSPARAGLSGDGRHGFTAGFMTIHRADGSVNPAKYLAYWERQQEGWRVLAYKRTPAKVAPPAATVSYLLPKQLTTAKRNTADIERDRESLAEAERSFSRDAQTIGIGAAFVKYGSPEAINLGSPDIPAFVQGNDAIGAAVGSGAPTNSSALNWGPEKTIIAASGDFGVTIGYINRNAPGPDGKTPPAQPFFTIWRREANGAWRYIAE
jgi:ketosteroid isomerase-like protein